MIHWDDAGAVMGQRPTALSLGLSPGAPPTVMPQNAQMFYASRRQFSSSPTDFTPRKAIRERLRRSRARLRLHNLMDSMPVIEHRLSCSSPTEDGPLSSTFSTQMFFGTPEQRQQKQQQLDDLHHRSHRGGGTTDTTQEYDPEVQCYNYEFPLGKSLSLENGEGPFQRFPPTSPVGSGMEADAIKITKINLMLKENVQGHHTDRFTDAHKCLDPYLILRRGQRFTIGVHFNREWVPNLDRLRLLAEIGDCPLESRGTRLDIPVFTEKTPDKLADDADNSYALITFLAGNSAKGASPGDSGSAALVTIHLGAEIIVGAWNLKLRTGVACSGKGELCQGIVAKARQAHITKQLQCVYPVAKAYVLFNPWCKDDQVYLSDEDERMEYVCNDVGKIWRGSHNAMVAYPWVYGQFEASILDVCFTVLHHSRLPLPLRSSPIQVTRAISAMISSPELVCVVAERWIPSFEDGVDPTAWTGSSEILRLYAASGRPVPYGQSWVFAGVFTTICRALGIPCRTVTGYCTAHDSETTTTIDVHFDIDGRPLGHLNTDSVWTYHAWSECWMERPDLPSGYEGWQVLDGTPTEKCDGVDNIGPTPVEAVAKGEVGLGYDTAVVFSEVNADIVYWLYTGSGVSYIRKEDDKIGLLISTRNPDKPLEPGHEDRLDITSKYKEKPAASQKIVRMMERLFNDASQRAIASQAMMPQVVEDVRVYMDLACNSGRMLGDDFHARIRLRNKSEALRTIHIYTQIDAIQYYDARPKKIKVTKARVQLDPKCESEIITEIKSVDYIERVMDHSVFKITVLCHVDETGQVFATQDDYRLGLPDISIQAPKVVTLGDLVKIRLELRNPIPVQLTHCRFTIEGPGLTRAKVIPCQSAMPLGIITAETQINPSRSGAGMHLVARFNSQCLGDFHGMTKIDIKPRPADAVSETP